MDIRVISDRLQQYIVAHSHFDLYRNYLGMSRIGDCSRQVVKDYLTGIVPSEATYRMSYAGYEQESNILHMLVSAQIAIPTTRELVAPFDSRLRGHIDAETREGFLVEIKSVSTLKFQRIDSDRRLHPKHFVQVQLYMRYGGYDRALVVYRNRETYEQLLFEVGYFSQKAALFEAKAKRILEAIDAKELPPCECGHCNK